MSTIPPKSGIGVNDLNRISDLIAKIPGNTTPSSGGADKQVNNTSRTSRSAEQTGLGAVIPNPGADKTATDGAIRPEVNPARKSSGTLVADREE